MVEGVNLRYFWGSGDFRAIAVDVSCELQCRAVLLRGLDRIELQLQWKGC